MARPDLRGPLDLRGLGLPFGLHRLLGPRRPVVLIVLGLPVPIGRSVLWRQTVLAVLAVPVPLRWAQRATRNRKRYVRASKEMRAIREPRFSFQQARRKKWASPVPRAPVSKWKNT